MKSLKLYVESPGAGVRGLLRHAPRAAPLRLRGGAPGVSGLQRGDL